MRKNVIKSILGVALATGVLGAAVFVGAKVEKAPVREAEAANSDGYVFVEISAATSYTNVYCHNWGTSGTTWPGTKMEKLQDNIYYCKLKSPSNNMVIFNNNNGKQTGDLSFNASANGRLFYMDSDTTAHVDDKTKYRMDYFVGTSTTPASDNSTTRLFIHHDDCSNWKTSSSTKVRCWGSSKYSNVVDAYVYDLSFFENNGTGASGAWYGYVDVPKDITGWELIRCNKDYWRDIWANVGANVTGSFSSRIWRLQEYGWDFYWNDNKKDSAAGGSLMGKIVEAYNTCLNDAVNGYGAYSELNSNFYTTATSAGKSQLATSLNGHHVSVQSHFEGMASRVNNAGGRVVPLIPELNSQEANTTFIVVAVAIVTLAATSGFFLLKKRKENR